jgi:hypothetical protein
VDATLTLVSTSAIDGSPVALTGTGISPMPAASVTGGPLVFGNQVTGSTSAPQTLTVTNTGNVALTAGTFTFGAGQPFSRPAGGAGGSCPASGGATLPVASACTINVVFKPTATGAAAGTLTVAYAGTTVTGSPVSLSGSGTAPASVSITPNPLTVTLPTGVNTGTGTVTLKNTAAPGGASVTITGVNVAGGTFMTFFFNKVLGSDHCTGTSLAPGATCTVGVRFTNMGSARGQNRPGTITFTDNGAANPQVGALIGHAN